MQSKTKVGADGKPIAVQKPKTQIQTQGSGGPGTIETQTTN